MIDNLIIKPASKIEVKNAAFEAVKAKIQAGEFTLKDYATLKRAEAAIEEMLKAAKNEAIRLLEQYSSKEDVIVEGIKFSTYTTKPTLNYSEDSEYKAIEAEIRAVEKLLEPLAMKLSARKEVLDNAFKNAGKFIMSDEDGVTVPVCSIAKKGVEVFKANY